MIPQVIKEAAEMERRSRELKGDGRRLAFVPTMGALHEGHLALMREARRHGDVVAVSIFVNPTQFNDKRDYEKYPRDVVKDLKKCEMEKVDIVFTPEEEEIYPPGEKEVVIPLPKVAEPLEGRSRPGHFSGVVRVVSKLFQIVRPHVALFGMKDYQQLRVIQEMVKEQGIDVEIVPCATVRSREGLALSSRNSRLSPKGLQQALFLSQSLKAAESLFQKGERGAKKIAERVQEKLSQRKEIQIDYVDVVDAESLKEITKLQRPALVAIAIFVEGVRLIDNCILSTTPISDKAFQK